MKILTSRLLGPYTVAPGGGYKFKMISKSKLLLSPSCYYCHASIEIEFTYNVTKSWKVKEPKLFLCLRFNGWALGRLYISQRKVNQKRRSISSNAWWGSKETKSYCMQVSLLVSLVFSFCPFGPCSLASKVNAPFSMYSSLSVSQMSPHPSSNQHGALWASQSWLAELDSFCFACLS